jgi:hypothetical protein
MEASHLQQAAFSFSSYQLRVYSPDAKLKLSSIVWRSTGIEQPNTGRQLQMMMLMKVF